MPNNIILIGMPGCGKSSAGALVAEKLQKTFIDLDKVIEEGQHTSISNIFASHGEEGFRRLESAYAAQMADKEKCIIATGGGIVLKKKNMDILRQGNLVLFINRPVQSILQQDLSGRPLLAEDKQKIYQIYQERLPLYLKYATICLENNNALEALCLQIVTSAQQYLRGFFELALICMLT